MYINENISNKQIIGLIIGFFFLIILAIIIHNLSSPNYESAKIEEDKEYVYKKETEEEGKDKNIPYLNVKGEDAKKINQEIAKIEEDFASLLENKIGFTFNKSGHILSLSIKMVNYYTEFSRPVTSFKTYNINLKTKKIYTKEEIYKDYGVDDKIISKSIEKKFRKMYKSVVKEGYIDSNYCDYNCFLKWRGVSNYLDDVELYIENRGLIAFRGFLTESVFGEENYYKSSDFKFEING